MYIPNCFFSSQSLKTLIHDWTFTKRGDDIDYLVFNFFPASSYSLDSLSLSPLFLSLLFINIQYRYFNLLKYGILIRRETRRRHKMKQLGRECRLSTLTPISFSGSSLPFSDPAITPYGLPHHLIDLQSVSISSLLCRYTAHFKKLFYYNFCTSICLTERRIWRVLRKVCPRRSRHCLLDADPKFLGMHSSTFTSNIYMDQRSIIDSCFNQIKGFKSFDVIGDDSNDDNNSFSTISVRLPCICCLIISDIVQVFQWRNLW